MRLGRRIRKPIFTMKNHPRSSFVPVFVFAAATFISLLPVDALARERSTHGTGPRNGTVDREVTRKPGKVDKSTTYTSPKGKISTRESERSKDAATGTGTGSSSTNLANGKTASSSFTSEKTDTGRTTTGERTGFNGKTSTYDSTRTNTDNGFTRDVTKTGPNGGALEKDITVSKEGNTVTRTETTTKTPPPTP